MTNIEYARGLRALADFYEKTPSMPLPYPQIGIYLYGREEFLKAAVTLSKGGDVEKKADDPKVTNPYYHVLRQFGTLTLDLNIPRSTICRLVTPAQYDCPDSFLAAAAEYQTHSADEPELGDRATLESLRSEM